MTRSPQYQLGAVVMSKNPSTSKLEDDVRQKLINAGLKLHKGRSAIQCGFDPDQGNYPVLTPDILIKSAKVAVEVDPDFTHGDEMEKDRSRNRLLAGVGWTVVRLRLGGLPALGRYDVISDSSGQTKAGIEALVEAVGDAVARRVGKVRRVTKSKSPVRTSPKSQLGSIAAHKYHYNAFYASWTDTDGEIHRLIMMDGGNYLAVDDRGGAPGFIVWLGSEGVPRTKWREPLAEVLSKLDSFASVTKYPWGDELWVGDQADKMGWEAKFDPAGESWLRSSNMVGIDEWNEYEFFANGSVIARLHDGALDAGWRVVDLSLHTGNHGQYQKFVLQRTGERAGRWVASVAELEQADE